MIFAYQLVCRQANSSHMRDATYTKQVKVDELGPQPTHSPTPQV